MKLLVLSAIVLLNAALFSSTNAQSLNTRREIEKANTETLPAGAEKIKAVTGTPVALEIDVASYGDDEKAWANLYVIVNRVSGAFGDVGKDQIGKDALAKGVKKVVIVKSGLDAKQDSAELKEGTLTVKTAGDDESTYTLQGVVEASLSKAL